MTHTRMLADFEAGTIDLAAFRHYEHVQVAYEMLVSYPFLQACHRYADALQTLATRAGVPDTGVGNPHTEVAQVARIEVGPAVADERFVSSIVASTIPLQRARMCPSGPTASYPRREGLLCACFRNTWRRA